MTAVLVDSNVLIDVAQRDPEWFLWSSSILARLGEGSRLVINPIILAEVSASVASPPELEAALPSEYFQRESPPWETAFLAGKCFVEYRRRGGQTRSPPPDLYVGAHAVVRGYRLLTRDPNRYRTYFPSLEILAPAT